MSGAGRPCVDGAQEPILQQGKAQQILHSTNAAPTSTKRGGLPELVGMPSNSLEGSRPSHVLDLAWAVPHEGTALSPEPRAVLSKPRQLRAHSMCPLRGSRPAFPDKGARHRLSQHPQHPLAPSLLSAQDLCHESVGSHCESAHSAVARRPMAAPVTGPPGGPRHLGCGYTAK